MMLDHYKVCNTVCTQVQYIDPPKQALPTTSSCGLTTKTNCSTNTYITSKLCAVIKNALKYPPGLFMRHFECTNDLSVLVILCTRINLQVFEIKYHQFTYVKMSNLYNMWNAMCSLSCISYQLIRLYYQQTQ